MAKDGNVGVTELRAATAQTRLRIAETVNAISDRVSTAIGEIAPEARSGTLESRTRSLARSLASMTTVRVVARRLGSAAQTQAGISALVGVSVGVGLWLWLRSREGPGGRLDVQ